jgi:hypothetical protein
MRVVGLLWLIACSGTSAPDEHDPKPTPAPVIDARGPVADAADVVEAKDGMPGACVRYRALADKLAGCTALGPQRDVLRGELEASWKAWPLLSDAERAKATEACTAAVRAIEVACP